MKNYCIYDVNGKIIQYGTCPAVDVLNQIPAGSFQKIFSASFVAPESQHYINAAGEHVECSDYDLSSLPMPCSINIEGADYDITEIPTFTFDAPGIYDLYVSPADAQFKDKVLQIDY